MWLFLVIECLCCCRFVHGPLDGEDGSVKYILDNLKNAPDEAINFIKYFRTLNWNQDKTVKKAQR